MRNNSVSLFVVEGIPELRCVSAAGTLRLIVHDSVDEGVIRGTLNNIDFSISAEHEDRLRRSCDAFNAAMKENCLQG